MSLLIRAAILGGIAYFITRSMRANATSGQQRWAGEARRSGVGSGAPVDELHPDESNVWPTSESKQTTPATAGPTS